MKSIKLQSNKERRQKRIRAKISGTADRPRFAVFKSNTAIYAQLIDDDKGVTLASNSGQDASAVGESVAKQALEKKIKKVVFDRGGYIYIGKIKELAESARKAGLEF